MFDRSVARGSVRPEEEARLDQSGSCFLHAWGLAPEYVQEQFSSTQSAALSHGSGGWVQGSEALANCPPVKMRPPETNEVIRSALLSLLDMGFLPVVRLTLRFLTSLETDTMESDKRGKHLSLVETVPCLPAMPSATRAC